MLGGVDNPLENRTIIGLMDKAKIYEVFRKIYFYPKKPSVVTNAQEDNSPEIEMAAEERKLKFRRYLTDTVSQGWHIEIENEYDAVISRKNSAGWFGPFLIFILLLLIFAPLALFYLIYLIVSRSSGKKKLLKVWIDIYGNVKTNG